MPTIALPHNHPYSEGRACTTCGEFKSADQYTLNRDKRSFGGVSMRSKCKACEELRKWKSDIKRRYGITYKDYCHLLDKQKGLCAICGSKDAQNSRTYGKLFIDHCHTTGKVRGLLCSKCNHALGQFNDDISLLLKAVEYLKENP